MRKIIAFITFVLLGIFAFSQNTSPLVVKDFVLKSNEIIDLEQIPKFNRTDLDNNPICRIKVKAVGFEEGVLQKFVFVPNGIEITNMVYKDGMWYLHVSSNKSGEINIKYMGDFTFRLPYQLEPGKVYELLVGMETATLVIRTIPTNAEIYIDNEKAGVGEAIKAVSIGAEHRYRVSCDDYYTKEGVVQFSKREEKSINVELESNFGYITIKTDPMGADVYVDDVKVGTTPYQMKKITLGSHVVELRRTGFESYADIVNIVKGEVNRQLENVTLAAMRLAYGTLYVASTPEDADITIDGEYMGRTPQTLELVAGDHTVMVTKQGSTPATKTVMVNEGMTTNVNLYLESGREMTLSTNGTGDKIYVDGTYIGDSPLKTMLGYGKHEIQAVRGEDSVKKSIVVEKNGGDTSVQLNFSDIKTFTANGVPFEMVTVKGGYYTIGKSFGLWKSYDEKKVKVSDFYIGKYEVTQELWDAVMGDQHEQKNYPMNWVNWANCQNFIKKLNQLTGKNFRLPTSEEWEFAARGGNKSKGYQYSGSNKVDDVAWYWANSGGGVIHPVGTKQPNELGIYDMNGNVSEWCQNGYVWNDWGRAVRGGNYGENDSYCKIGNQYENQIMYPYMTVNEYTKYFGLRLALSVSDDMRNGVMDISTCPEGSEITINGKYYGHTPVTLDSLPGEYVVKYSKYGYENVEHKIQLKAGMKESSILNLKRIKHTQDDNGGAGVFSISEDSKVCFAKGNLQYQPSTKIWRFAEYQWDYVGTSKKDAYGNKGGTVKGSDNSYVSPTYEGWVDLFEWSTGDNPIRKVEDGDSCIPFNDWGNNNISNGDGYSWFTLSPEEWEYIIVGRKTISGINYVLATVNGVQGLIILPDNWKVSNYNLSQQPFYKSNKISQDVWMSSFEPNGAVFLPATCGERFNYNYKVEIAGSPEGYYWLSENYNYGEAFVVSFHKYGDVFKIYSEDGFSLYHERCDRGYSVRLVRMAE